MRQKILVGFLLAPPLALLIAGLFLVAVSPLEWGTAGDADLPPWMLPVIDAALGLSAALIGGLALRSVWRRTRDDFSIGWVLLAVGVLGLLAAAAFTFALAVEVSQGEGYETLGALGSDDKDGFATQPPSIYLALNLFAVLLYAALQALVAAAHCEAVSPLGPKRYARRADEPDPMQEILTDWRR